VQTHEAVFEINHRWYLTPFFSIQPDPQYVILPGAAGQFDDALVLGAQMSVSF
jgi:carbohydrate-selective porin OprB